MLFSGKCMSLSSSTDFHSLIAEILDCKSSANTRRDSSTRVIEPQSSTREVSSTTSTDDRPAVAAPLSPGKMMALIK
jgi:hypothetical protein